MSANKQTVETYIDGVQQIRSRTDPVVPDRHIQWTVFGACRLSGEEAYDSGIENPAFVGSPTVTIVRMVEEGDVVMAEMTVEVQRSNGETMRAAMGEVFVMANTTRSKNGAPTSWS